MADHVTMFQFKNHIILSLSSFIFFLSLRIDLEQGETMPGEVAVSSFRAKLGLVHRFMVT